MHGGRGAASAGLLALLPSCASLHADKHTYEASSPAVEVGGAMVRMQVRPEGADNAFSVSAMVVSTTVATLDGPFRWRIEATGEPGRQEKLIVRRIRTRTAVTKRDEWFPASELNRYASFKPQDGGTTRALYPIPGMLKVKPREDGALTVDVDLAVVANGRETRRMVRFRMDPAQGRRDEFVFIPAEIVENIGKSPEEWEESGWD